MIVLFLLIHTAYGRVSDTRLDYPVLRNVSSCPEVGYFFRRQPGENFTGEQCHLCFCQDESVAVCWRHNNRICDSRSYVRDRRLRSRRSPGFADLFFQDAARDMFKKQSPEECKPFESSHSVGCPPADWCIGCTVCDCNANGRWDCHVISFCPGDKPKKRSKRKRTVINAMKMKTPFRSTTLATKATIRRMQPTRPITKRTISTRRPAQVYKPVQSKMKGTTPTNPTPRRNMPIQSKVKKAMPTKSTTRRTTPKSKRTLPTNPARKKTVQTKPTIKRTIEKKPAVRRTLETKPAIKTAAAKKAASGTTTNKISKNVNQMKIKTNQMMQINAKSRKEVFNKTNNSSPKKLAISTNPVEKKSLAAKVKPALRSFQRVSGKPIKNNTNKSKSVTNATVVAKNISSKVMKSAEKIINENQKKASKLITIEEPPKKTIKKSNFKSKLQKNSTIIDMTNKMKEKVILNKKYEVTTKRTKPKK